MLDTTNTNGDSHRKLVSAQTIEALHPIPGADRIELARVKGWNVVVGKGLFQPGDIVAYFETDSLLPETDKRYESFQKRGQRSVYVDGIETRGHVLQTMKMRGQISQGLVMSLEELGSVSMPVGTDLTDIAGVVKYEAPIPVGSNIIGEFDTLFAPKTDAERLQNLTDVWEEIKELSWTPTVKVDGTSQTLVNDTGKLRIFGRNKELDPDTAPGMQVAKEAGITEILHPGETIQFELCGPNIQANRLRLPRLRPFIFAFYNNGVKVHREFWPTRLLTWAAPELDAELWAPSGNVDEMIEKVSGLRGNITKNVLDEGIVYHLDSETAPMWMDRNENFKIINNKFLLKHGL